MSKRFMAEGRFEVPKIKPRHQSLNDALRNSKNTEHEIKHGGFQKRSRLAKHFKHAIEDWLDEGDEYDDDY